MYIRQLNIDDFTDVSKLESSVYPEGMCLGADDYKNDFNKVSEYKRNCLGAFIKGELVGYIIGYLENGKDSPFDSNQSVYVSDFLCTNKRSILPLLIQFSNRVTYSSIKAEFRSTSYRIIKHIMKKYPDVISDYTEEFLENYNDGEDQWRLSFRINTREFHKYLDLDVWDFMLREESPTVQGIVQHLKINFTIDQISENRNYILKTMYRHISDVYSMMPDNLQYMVTYRIKGYHNRPEGAESFKNKLIEKIPDMREISTYDFDTCVRTNSSSLAELDKTYNVNDSYVTWNILKTLDNSKYNDNSLAYYRHFFGKHLMGYELLNKRPVSSINILDNKGYSIKLITRPKTNKGVKYVPYINNISFDMCLDKLRFLESINKKFSCLFEGENTGYIQEELLYNIRRIIGKDYFNIFVDSLIDRIKVRAEELLHNPTNNLRGLSQEKLEEKALSSAAHDYLYIIYEIEASKSILTTTAMRKLMMKNQESMVATRQLLSSLKVDYKDKKRNKILRKEVSSIIRRNLSLKEYILGLNAKADENFLKSKKMNNEMILMLQTFMSKMRRYTESITAEKMFANFGDKVKDIIQGKLEGLFEPCGFLYKPIEVGLLVKECLGVKGVSTLVKHPRKLYTALCKIADIKDILIGNIYGNDINLVLNELKQRHVYVPNEYFNLCNLYAKIEPKCSPEYLTAGDASVCCMSFGQNKANTYALEKGFGIFNIYYKDRVIANSVLWVNSLYNCLVLDNIEVHPNYVHLNDHIKNLYKDMIEKTMIDTKVDFTVQGSGYNDLELYKDEVDDGERWKSNFVEPKNSSYIKEFKTIGKDIKPVRFYSDTHTCFVVALSKGFSLAKAKEFVIESNDKLEDLMGKKVQANNATVTAPTFTIGNNGITNGNIIQTPYNAGAYNQGTYTLVTNYNTTIDTTNTWYSTDNDAYNLELDGTF